MVERRPLTSEVAGSRPAFPANLTTLIGVMKMNKVMDSFVGKTIKQIDNHDGERLVFFFTTGEVAQMLHYQDCCEWVTIDDICGDLDDLIGSPLVLSEEVSSDDEAFKKLDVLRKLAGVEHHGESETWTFYRMGTTKGSVTIRWYGTSNGYYSEYVSVEYVKN